MTYYNPLDKYYKSHIGAVSAKTEITFRVKGDFDSVVFILKKDNEDNCRYLNMQKTGDCFVLNAEFDVGLYFYRFSVGGDKFLGLGENYCGVITDKPNDFQLTVYDKDYSVPEWLKGGVIYQIFPDRFCNGGGEKLVHKNKILHKTWSEMPIFEPNEKGQILNNDFFGGDLKGIINKLEYIKSLGVNAIYLNPIFEAFSNHRYDTGDYMKIDPLLGTEEDFINLINTAENLGIKIILDGVFNHTGDDSLYFNKYGNYDSLGAYQSKDSKYYGWYNFKNYPEDYESWWGITVLPSVNESNPDYVEYITGENGVIEKYTKLGIGGWRLDVVDELPTAFVQKIRTATKNINKNAIVIGEVWEDASNKISYGVRREYFQGKELDSVMNYPLEDAILNFVKSGEAKDLARVIKEQIDHYPHQVLHSLMNILSTHDTYRLLSAVNSVDISGKSKKETSIIKTPPEKMAEAIFRLKVASLLQYTLCGVPSIYYGDEIGMEGYSDPLNRQTYPWGQENTDILDWYKFLGDLRGKYSAFNCGNYKEIYVAKGKFVFAREDCQSSVMIAINLSDKPFSISYLGELTDLISNEKHKNEFCVLGRTFAVLINENIKN